MELLLPVKNIFLDKSSIANNMAEVFPTRLGPIPFLSLQERHLFHYCRPNNDNTPLEIECRESLRLKDSLI